MQSASGAANYGERFPLGARIGNAIVAYIRYLGKAVWPESLSPLYLHPGYWPAMVVWPKTRIALAAALPAAPSTR